MSRENVDLFRKAIDAYNRGDIEAMAATFADDGEWYPPSSAVEGDAAYLGPAGVRNWWANVGAAFSDVQATIEGVRDLGDVVLGVGRLRGQFQSGIAYDVEIAWVARYRDGLSFSARAYFDRAEALEAVGLSE